MPQEPQNPKNQRPDRRPRTDMSAAEYRKMQQAKEQRRKKRRQQQLLVIGAIALAAILLIVMVVLVVRSIIKKGDDTTSTPSSPGSSVSIPVTDGLVTWPTAGDKSVWNLWLINKQQPVVDGFERPDMVEVASANGASYWFDTRIVDALNQMIADCNAVEGHSLMVVSGFRSYEWQEKNFQHYVDSYRSSGKGDEEAYALAEDVTPLPGTTDHHTGLAADFSTAALKEQSDAFADTPEYAWLVENAAGYGFILRFPGEKAAITGVNYKPYHWRFVGVEDAVAIQQAGLSLEEYLAVLPAGSTPATTSDAPEDGAGSQTSDAG